ncbi:MAG: hypothetical protein EXS31_02695 [Pedosphaera sp.]|nr:hypothetical protein [Pedosphaera sp.]
MMSPTGNPNADHRAAFTLVELLLVMAMLVIVIGVSFPMLKGFFRGRSIDSEARRLLSLTRYGQSRAVSEGIPMVLWIDARNKSYGLQIQTGYVDQDTKSVTYTLDNTLEIEAQLPFAANATRSKPVIPGLGDVPMIRFMPDGFIGESSPDRIVLRQGEETAIWIIGNSNRLEYAIQSQNPSIARR